MKRRNIIIIAGVAVIGILAIIVALSGSRKSTFKQDFHIADTSSITRIFLADKQNNKTLLRRGDDSIWMVDDKYIANQKMVDLLLETLNTMRIRQQVNKNAIPNVVNDISAYGIQVEVYQKRYLIDWFSHHIKLFPKEKLTVTYFVGRETQDLLASHVYRKGDKVPYIIHIPGFRGFITPRFVTNPTLWRSHRITDLNVHEIERVELNITESPSESFAIQRQGEGFAFQMLQPPTQVDQFDTARVAQMLSCFTNLNFDEFADIVPNSFADSCVSTTPRTILRITDTSGISHELKTYIKYTNPDDFKNIGDSATYEVFDLNRLYAILDNHDTVLIQYYVFDNILQPASYFLGNDKTHIAR